ncbi:unnamed protein product, partial [Ectocarpus sp. 12 AP-2014]
AKSCRRRRLRTGDGRRALGRDYFPARGYLGAVVDAQRFQPSADTARRRRRRRRGKDNGHGGRPRNKGGGESPWRQGRARRWPSSGCCCFCCRGGGRSRW